MGANVALVKGGRGVGSIVVVVAIAGQRPQHTIQLTQLCQPGRSLLCDLALVGGAAL